MSKRRLLGVFDFEISGLLMRAERAQVKRDDELDAFLVAVYHLLLSKDAREVYSHSLYLLLTASRSMISSRLLSKNKLDKLLREHKSKVQGMLNQHRQGQGG